MSNDTRPEIRFPGFTEDWEERKLGDISDVTKLAGFEFTKYVTYSDEGEVIALRGLNVKNGNLVLDEVKYIDGSDFSKLNRSRLYKNDILFTYVGTVGELAVVPEDDKYYLAPNVARIRMNEGANPLFVSKLMNDKTFYNKIILPLIATSSQPALSMENVRKFTLMMPEIEEQEKIAVFLGSLDNLIFLHQRKLDLLKETKKGFLQKMFPKNGAKVPEIRFLGFTEDWEERRLSDVASIVGGGTPSTSNPEYWEGDIDWYAPAEIGDQIYVSKSLKTITELGQQKSSAKILPIGTVLFTSRAGIGNTAILAKEGTTNQGFQSIVPHKNKLDSYFIFSRTHELKRYGEVTGAGSTFAEVSGKQMAKMPILIPCINEQRKIGEFFEQLDTTITLHQRELDVLKETKKGFLQKMFV
ncbi:restriction endonuclease subunit S [Enterococcus faecalis]|uniref:restriction endonuclease subunit S n=1 Tax=Enterococcus TaxID=1350 RepID=UPI001A02A2F3|nr:restriction endonuclease subunit S [Enterococcus faecalis]EHU5022938.1 restriction endonuclease subunit S [Enterococcus faecalis]EKZ0165269.1 restriction endonuclease subunit S [Enterococcus faecalis]